MRLIDRLGNKLVSFGCDRWVHLVMCLAVSWLGATVAGIAMGSQYEERPVVGLVGIAVGVIAGICKEVFDKLTTGKFDDGDLSADFVGVALFYIVYCV